MTVGELRVKLADIEDDAIQIEIICPYEDADGDAVERAYDIVAVEKRLDPDTAAEFVCLTCGDA